MAVDRVQVMVRETTATGGADSDEEDYPHPIQPNEDGIEVRRVYIQNDSSRDETVYVDRDSSNNATIKDAALPEVARFVDTVFVRPVQDRDITVPAGFVWMRHDLELADGTDVTVENGAEVLIL